MVTYVSTSQVIDCLGQPGKSARQLGRLARAKRAVVASSIAQRSIA
jgi:hypothetical protein